MQRLCRMCPSPRLAALGDPCPVTGLPVQQTGWGTGRLFSHANDSSTSNCTARKLLRSSAQRTAPSRGGSKERVSITNLFCLIIQSSATTRYGTNLRPEALLCIHLGGTLSEGVSIAWLGLDTDFGSLHWSQSDVSKELCAS